MTNLLMLIDDNRREMIELANKHGLSSEQTVKSSQQLDALLNQLMFEEQNKRTSQIS